jgi:hypothetical protein
MVEILDRHENALAHFRDDVGIDVEVDNGKSHLYCSFQVARERTGVPPLLKEFVVEVNSFLDLSQSDPPLQFSQQLSFIEFEVLTLFKIDAILDGPNAKDLVGETVSVCVADGQ